MPASAPLSHRIEGEAAESTAGDYAPYIESTDEALAYGRWAARGASPSTDAQRGQKPAKDDGSPRLHGIGWPAAKARRLRTTIRNRDLRGIESPAGAIESISRDFDAAWRQTHAEISPQGPVSRPAHAADGCAICVPFRPGSPETCAQTRDTGYRPLGRKAREATAPLNGLGVI